MSFKPSFFINFFLVGLSLPVVIYAFDYYVLAKTWSPEFCLENPNVCLLKPNPSFSLHGLWPQYKNGKYPSFCQPCEEFKKEKLNQLTGFIQKLWTNNGIINYDFLKHEWEKHGCCSNISLFNYFNASLKLAEKWNYLRVWQSIEINPSYENKTISSSLMETTAKDFCGNKCDFALNCDNQQYLSGYYMTLSKEFDVYNNSGIKGNCDENIYWEL